MCKSNHAVAMNVAVHLKTKEEANTFFEQTEFPTLSYRCAKTNWDYQHETAYHIGNGEFGNVRMYQSELYREGTVRILTLREFLFIMSIGIANNLVGIKFQANAPEDFNRIQAKASAAAFQ